MSYLKLMLQIRTLLCLACLDLDAAEEEAEAEVVWHGVVAVHHHLQPIWV